MCASVSAQTPSDVIAKRPGLPSVVEAELRDAVYPESDSRRLSLLESITSARTISDEILLTREWARQQQSTYPSGSPEGEYIAYQKAVMAVKAATDIAERRAVAALRADVVEARAREIWLQETAKYQTEITANVTALFIDTHKHGFPGALKRWQDIQREVRQKKPFEQIAAKWNDDQKAGNSAALTFDVVASQAEGELRRKVFFELPIGEVSVPIATNRGWVVAKVNSRKAPSKKPFDEVKSAIMDQVVAEVSKKARSEFLTSLRATPTAYLGRLAATEAPAGPTIDVDRVLRDAAARGETDPARLQELLKQALEDARRQVPDKLPATQPSTLTK